MAEPVDTNIPGIDRLLALTDGVVAIALTLLVLQLQVPVANIDVKDPTSAAQLWHELNQIDVSELTSYLVSFLVIAQFWLVHHRAMRGMRGHSEGLAWRNFGFLLALTLMPFTSDLIGRYGSNPVAITLFALNLAAISLASQWIVLYADSHHLVSDEQKEPHEQLAARVRVVLVLSIVALSILLAWFATSLAKFSWLLFLFVPPAAVRITALLEGRGDKGTPKAAAGHGPGT